MGHYDEQRDKHEMRIKTTDTRASMNIDPSTLCIALEIVQLEMLADMIVERLNTIAK